jgi:hypothetical protein
VQIYDEKSSLMPMKRVTFSLNEADHLALKLLAIQQRKAMIGVVQEAITKHLEETGAYRLSVSEKKEH